MRLATIRTGDGTHAARVEGDALVELDYPRCRGAAALGRRRARPCAGRRARDRRRARTRRPPTSRTLVLDPGKIVCVGVNYADHIAEMGRELPEFPTLFAKYTDALIGARDDIWLPRVSDMVDWEVELAVVIGHPVRHASPDEAAAAIAGFTVANDISMRDWQNRTLQWLQGKTFEHATPIGPWMVTPDEVGGTAPDLELTLRGRRRRCASTAARRSSSSARPRRRLPERRRHAAAGRPHPHRHARRRRPRDGPAGLPARRPGGAHGDRRDRRARQPSACRKPKPRRSAIGAVRSEHRHHAVVLVGRADRDAHADAGEDAEHHAATLRERAERGGLARARRARGSSPPTAPPATPAPAARPGVGRRSVITPSTRSRISSCAPSDASAATCASPFTRNGIATFRSAAITSGCAIA